MLWSAFLIGLFGGAHCIGMCGPIAMALPHAGLSRGQLLGRLLLYNSGRVVTYMLLGVVLGLTGWGAALAGWQSGVSILAGVVLLLLLIAQWDASQELLRWEPLSRWFVRLRAWMGPLLSSTQPLGFFRLGVLNGFLPCGLVYLAIVGAIAAGGVKDGALYMMAFGIGTIPLMVAVVWLGQTSVAGIRDRLRQFYPLLIAAVAVFLIWRGLRFHLPENFTLQMIWQGMPMCH